MTRGNAHYRPRAKPVTIEGMGYLIYAGTHEYEFEDRTLAHLKVAITMKLRRQESFLMSWVNPADRGGGRVSIWLTPTIPLIFRFSGSRSPQLNRVWLEVLNEHSNTPRGLIVVPESEVPRATVAQPQVAEPTEHSGKSEKSAKAKPKSAG